MRRKVIGLTASLLLISSGVYAGSTIIDIEDNPYREAIVNAVDKGYMNVTDEEGNFKPDDTLTRAQLAQVLTRFEEEQATRLEEAELKHQQELDRLRQDLAKQVAENKSSNEIELKTIANSMKALVEISTSNGKGSGVFINENTILTAHHVVEGFGTTDIKLADYKDTITGTVIKTDEWQDLALIKIGGTLEKNNYIVTYLDFGEPATLGETVYAFGNPLNLNFSVSKGIISNNAQTMMFRSQYQFDAPINPGNSGGPLVDSEGRLIGIVTSFLKDNEGLQSDGIAFATPVEALKLFAGE